MWAASVFVAIAFAGAGFMLWFLIGLLGEGAPSVSYWVVPAVLTPGVRMAADRGNLMHALDEGGDEQNGPATQTRDLLESGTYVQEDSGSRLVSLDVRPAGARLGGSTIDHGGDYVFRER